MYKAEYAKSYLLLRYLLYKPHHTAEKDFKLKRRTQSDSNFVGVVFIHLSFSEAASILLQNGNLLGEWIGDTDSEQQ